MLDEGNTPNMMDTPEAPPPEEKSNRTFLIVGGGLAGLVFLTLVCMAVYFLLVAPRLSAQRAAQQATIEAGNLQVAQQVTLTAQAAMWTPTRPPATKTPLPSPQVSSTPLIAMAATATTDATALFAAQTQMSYQLTVTAAALPTTGFGGMPTTGFFDEVGLPSMIILALALVVVILLARRMRKSSAK